MIYSFTGGTDGNLPSSGLTVDSKGNAYGTTFYGGDLNCELITTTPGCGVVYKLTSTGKFSVVYAFTGLPMEPGRKA